MAKLYEIKPSAGRGNGVFATADLQPGTTVMSDKVGLRLEQYHGILEHEDVQRVFDRLSRHDQKRFLELHEGHRPLPTKLVRICKANGFGDTSSSSLRVYLEISRINHSCVPNAELGELDESTKVFAIKPISRGEEIFISYQEQFQAMTKQQRAGTLKAFFGFTCNCHACTLPLCDEQLSDCRRRLVNTVSYNLKGFKAPAMNQESLLHMTAAEVELPSSRSLRLEELDVDLSIQQHLGYNILLAGLLEAEGLTGITMALCYKHAAIMLAKQICKSPSIVLLPSVRILEDWLQRAIDTMKSARGAKTAEVNEIVEIRTSMRETDPISTVSKLVR